MPPRRVVVSVGDTADEVGVIEALEVGAVGTDGDKAPWQGGHPGLKCAAGCLGFGYGHRAKAQGHAGAGAAEG